MSTSTDPRKLDIPILRTERLRLEPLSRAHSAGMYAMWRRPEVCEFSGEARDYRGEPIALPARSPADSDKILDYFIRCAAEGTRFRWAVIAMPDEIFVGAVGFNSLNACAEYAYHLDPGHWHRGFALEASRAALHWLSERGGHDAVECFIEPANLASAALAARLGLKATGEVADGAARFAKPL